MNQPAARFGSETVINPERRQINTLNEIPNSDSHSDFSHNSGVWNRLFPSENDVAVGISPQSPEGLELGQFEVQDRIGLGGMGAVFSAYDRELDRIVALKVLSPTQSRDKGSVKRFQNEAKAAAKLNHENVAKVFSIGEEFGLHYIAFEFVDGLNVRSLLNRRGKLSPGEALSYILQISTALQHTGAAGVVHRDIKPSNIIIKSNGRAKLVDWGLARDVTESPASKDLTVAGTTLGTFDYISPEQAKDPRSVDVRSDIYSLGCTFYQMVTGEPPYGEGTVLQKLLDHQGKNVPDPHQKNPAVTPQMAAVIMKMMASEPGKRYQTVETLISDLMMLATQFGLRGIPADSMIWDKPQDSVQSNSFLRQNAGLLGTAALLILGVLFMDWFSSPQSSSQNNLVENKIISPQSDTFNNKYENSDLLTNNPVGTGVESFNESNLITNNGIGPTIQFPNILLSKEFSPFDPAYTSPLSKELTNSIILGNPDASQNPTITNPSIDLANGSTTVTTPSKEMVTVVEQSPFIVIQPDGKRVEKTYRTLEGAVLDATDGSVVELRFNSTVNNPREEKPFDISKKNITIRAAKDFSPVVKFVRDKFDAPGMIRVIGGGLTLNNVQFIADVERKGISSHWTFLYLVDPREVRLQSVAMTIKNPSRSSASLIEVVANPDEDFEDMAKPGSNSSSNVPLLDIDSSIIRISTDFISYSHTASMRIDIRQSAIATEGIGLNNSGDDSFREFVGKIELGIQHTTFLSNGGLVLINRGDLDFAGDTAAIDVKARNCIFGTTNFGECTFVKIEGALSKSDFKEQFNWEGQQNYYDGFSEFLRSNYAPGTTDILPTLDFEGWKTYWGSTSDNAPQLDATVWKSDKRDAPFVEWDVDEFLLQSKDENNPAISLGSGFNPELLPTFEDKSIFKLDNPSGIVVPPPID